MARSDEKGTRGADAAETNTRTAAYAPLRARGAELGFFADKTAQVGARVNPELLRLAKARTGVRSDSELIELALASLVIEDGFAEAFERLRGRVDEDVPLGL